MPKSAVRQARKEARARREIEDQLQTEQRQLDATRERLLNEKLGVAHKATSKEGGRGPSEERGSFPLSESSTPDKLAQIETVATSLSDANCKVTTMAGNDVKVKTLQVTVQAGLMKQVPLEVVPGNYISWDFHTEGGDIGFAVLLERPDGDIITVVEDDKVPSHEMGIQGTLIVEEAGRLWLQWDNSYSWMTNKDLSYTVKLLAKCPESRQPNIDANGNGTDPVAAASENGSAIPVSQHIPKIVFVLGPPGAGKGTICASLSDKFGFPYLSTDKLLHEEPETKFRSLIDGYIRDGKSVPIEITVQVLLKAMRARPTAECFLVDGFPASQDDLDGWARETGSSVDVKGALYLDCPDGVLGARLSEQKTDPSSIQERLKEYRTSVSPITEHFEKRGLLCQISSDRPVKDVLLDLDKLIQALVFDNNASASLKAEPEALNESSTLNVGTKDPASLPTAVPEALPAATASPEIAAPAVRAAKKRASASLAEKKPLRVILGTMTFTGQTSPEDSLEMMNIFASSKCVRDHLSAGRFEIDTARAYNLGEGETLIGDILAQRNDFKRNTFVATKANCFPGMGDSLRPESVTAQVTASLKALQLKSVDVLYLHNPDHSTDLRVTLEACNKLFRAGKFRELGLSNYSAWQTVQAYYICKENGWVKPSLYQGMYNAITRDVERELLPALKSLGIRFYAYNPLAGGLLTAKHSSFANAPTDESRFGANPWGAKYRERYWTEEHFAALATVQKACDASSLKMTDASIAWVMNHSELVGGLNDGVILGASKIEHLEQNLEAASLGPLPQNVLDAFDQAWKTCKGVCPSYSR